MNSIKPLKHLIKTSKGLRLVSVTNNQYIVSAQRKTLQELHDLIRELHTFSVISKEDFKNFDHEVLATFEDWYDYLNSTHHGISL